MFKQNKIYPPILFSGYVLVIWSFLLPNLINSTCIILLAGITLYGAVKKIFKFSMYSLLSIFPLFFIYIAIGSLYSTNTSEALNITERHLGLVFIPLITQSFSILSRKQKENLELYFISGLVAIGLFCLLFASYISFKGDSFYVPNVQPHFVYNYFMHHRLTAPTGLHAIFLSFYFSFANILIINRLLFNPKSLTKTKKILYIFIFIFICVLLYLLKSANFAFIFPLVSVILIILKIKNKLTSTKVKLFIALLLISTSSLSYIVVKNKLDSFTTSYDLSDSRLGPLAIRLGIWECTWELIEDNFVFGIGTGDGHDALLKKYDEKGFYIGYTDKFNVHNMYLQYWLSNGIIGVAFFISILTLLSLVSIKRKNIPMFCLVLFFAIFSITESTMFKQKGIVFFLFFTCVFFWNPDLWNKKLKATE